MAAKAPVAEAPAKGGKAGDLVPVDRPENFINRELSWLDFNFRVLGEAENDEVPLLERLKFLAIVSSNLDEFFMVRVANVKRGMRLGKHEVGPDGLSPRRAFEKISAKIHEMTRRQYECFDREVMPKINAEGIRLVRTKDYTGDDRAFLETYFENQVYPVLTPMAVDPGHPFPLLASGAIYIMFNVKPVEGVPAQFYGQTDTVLVQVPGGINRFISLPADENETRVAVLDDVIRVFADKLVHGYDIEGTYPFRVLRDAEMEVEEDADDLLSAIESELRSRRWGVPVKLEVRSDMPEDILVYLKDQLGVDEADVYIASSLIDLKTLFGLYGVIDRPDLCDDPWPQLEHPRLPKGCDLFAAIREGDIVMHVPYQKFDPVVELIARAAEDEKVLAIKMTLYRVSGNSPIVRSLIRAAENGKQVTVLVELRARFDEEANIEWAKRLDAAGAHVIYGVVGYKTHAKACLIVRRETDGIRRYVHLATGNYNDKTAKLYTDIGYMTARPEFGADLSGFFNVITGYSLPPRFNRIAMAPTDLRNKVLELIEREIEKHTPETPGHISAKMNSLIDPTVIQMLYKASQAGVQIDLLVRGLCRLRAGVPGLSETITVRSILDRYLEHPRIFWFQNGGAPEVYCASADWMDRNFDRRLELIFPIVDADAVKEVEAILDIGFEDNVKAWEMQPDGRYERVPEPKTEKDRVHSQRVCYEMCMKASKKKARGRSATYRAAKKPK